MAAPMAGRNNNKTWKLLREIWTNKHLAHSFRAMHLGNPLHTSSSADCGGESEVTSDGTRWWRLSGGARLAYRRRPGTRRPGVVFCPGFQSHMNGTKAEALETYCRRRGHPYVRFDYEGCGESDGDIRHVTLSDWRDNVLTVLDHLTTGPQVVVGSSMGAWLSVMAAVLRPRRVHAVLGIAAAPDFTQRAMDRLPAKALAELSDTGETVLDSEYGQFVVTQRFLDDAASHGVLSGDPVPLRCPLVLVHGMQDRSVPYSLSLRLAEKVESKDVRVVLRKAGDHRLSTPDDLQILFEELDRLLASSQCSVTPSVL